MPGILAEIAELPPLRNFVAYATKFRRGSLIRAEREHSSFSAALRARHDIRESEFWQRPWSDCYWPLARVLSRNFERTGDAAGQAHTALSGRKSWNVSRGH